MTNGIERIKSTLSHLSFLAQGGTAVGTVGFYEMETTNEISNFIKGLNTKRGFDVKIAAEISKITGFEFKTAPNKVYFCSCGVERLLTMPSSRHWLLMMH